MELCFNEMTVMKNGTLPEDIALCAQAGFSAVELRKGTLLRYLRGGGTLEALRLVSCSFKYTSFHIRSRATEIITITDIRIISFLPKRLRILFYLSHIVKASALIKLHIVDISNHILGTRKMYD